MKESDERVTECIDINIEMPWGPVLGLWYGNRQVRPILALHGWLDNIGTWNNLLPLLPTHIGILCIDLPGHGRSSRFPPGMLYGSWDYIRVVLRIMQTYNWQKISILSHSMSSAFSIIFAATCPEKVDLFISIDVVSPPHSPPKRRVAQMRNSYEKFEVEEERNEQANLNEPPSYDYEELQHVQYKGSSQSVALDNCKHILERNIAKSKLYPDKYYFSRDGRLKYFIDMYVETELALAMARRLRNVPFCVIKGSQSNFISEQNAPVIATLRDINPHFEIHELPGTHHVHLNDAASVAAVVNPFINRYRPPLLNAWTVDKDANDSRANARKMIKNQIKLQNHKWLKWKSKL